MKKTVSINIKGINFMIEEDAYELLQDMVKWININGDAIYSTRAIAPYKEDKICYTNKKNSG